MTVIDYSQYRWLARRLRGDGGALKPTTDAALPPASDKQPIERPAREVAPMHARGENAAPAPLLPDPQPRPVNTLLARLDAAANDAARAALLAVTPEVVRDDLNALLTYKVMVTPPRVVGLDELVEALHGAADNAERGAVLAGANLEQRNALAEHLRWRMVPVIDVQRHYLSLVE